MLPEAVTEYTEEDRDWERVRWEAAISEAAEELLPEAGRISGDLSPIIRHPAREAAIRFREVARV